MKKPTFIFNVINVIKGTFSGLFFTALLFGIHSAYFMPYFDKEVKRHSVIYEREEKALLLTPVIFESLHDKSSAIDSYKAFSELYKKGSVNAVVAIGYVRAFEMIGPECIGEHGGVKKDIVACLDELNTIQKNELSSILVTGVNNADGIMLEHIYHDRVLLMSLPIFSYLNKTQKDTIKSRHSESVNNFFSEGLLLHLSIQYGLTSI
jgi:hypothetical protein